jgi:hypothetical protein
MTTMTMIYGGTRTGRGGQTILCPACLGFRLDAGHYPATDSPRGTTVHSHLAQLVLRVLDLITFIFKSFAS